MTKPLAVSGTPRPRVLLVDDDDLVHRAIARMLRREFDVVTAVDAADALAKIADGLYAVVTDHDLGVGTSDGRHVLTEVRRRAPSARRILISGEPRLPRQDETGLWHAMLLKPISRDELFAALGIRGTK